MPLLKQGRIQALIKNIIIRLKLIKLKYKYYITSIGIYPTLYHYTGKHNVKNVKLSW